MSRLVLSWIILGAVAGLLVYLWSPKKIPGGLISDLAIGIVGGLIGGYLIATATGIEVPGGDVTWGSLIVSTISGIILLVIVLSELPARTPSRRK